MRYELSEGKLITMPPAEFRHSRISQNIFIRLLAAAKERGAGEVFIETAYMPSSERHTLRVASPTCPS